MKRWTSLTDALLEVFSNEWATESLYKVVARDQYARSKRVPSIFG